MKDKSRRRNKGGLICAKLSSVQPKTIIAAKNYTLENNLKFDGWRRPKLIFSSTWLLILESNVFLLEAVINSFILKDDLKIVWFEDDLLKQFRVHLDYNY